MKKLANLNGVKALNRREQQSINGGSGWGGVCFPSEGKCNYYCDSTCTPCGPPDSNGPGYTPHVCNDPIT